VKNILFITILVIFGLTFDVTAQNVLLYTPAAGTITNTSADTLTFSLPTKNYDYLWSVQSTPSTGTDSLNVVIEEAPCSSCSTWKQVGSTDVTGGTGSINLITWQSGTLYGLRQRIIVTGVGTQSTTYSVYAVFRRKD